MKKPNTGMVVSSVAHVAVLAYAVVGFSNAKPYTPSMESVAVEVLTPSEFDALTKGDRNSKKVADTPKVAAKKVAPVEAEPKPALPEKKENVEATRPPEPEAPKAPEPPKPAPKKAETPPPPEKKPEPPKQAEAPPPPEPKPADAPKPAEKKPEPRKEDPIQKVLDTKPEPKKPAPKKVEKKPQPKFDPTKIASLIDKRDPGRTPQAAAQASDITTAGISKGTASQLQLTRSSMLGNMIREQLYNCWNPPVGTQGMRDLVATIEFNLTQDGVLAGQPRLLSSSSNPAFQAYADSAMRAVHACTQASRPLRLPPEDYNIWRIVTLDFILPET